MARHGPLRLTLLIQLLAVILGLLSESAPVVRASSPGAPGPGLALGVYRPAFPDKMIAVDEYEQGAQTRLAIVHWFAPWGGWKSRFSRSDLDAVDRRGSLPLTSWEPWAGRPYDPEWSLLPAILSGRSDAYIETWARGLADFGKPVILRFAHEMHPQKYPWALGVNGNTTDDYVSAWHYVHGFFERAGATNVRWVWTPNTIGTAPAAQHLELYRALYPGDDQVDLIGMDIYNTGPNLNWGAPYWRSFAEALREPYTAITVLADKPLILPEVGSAESGGSKADWIRQTVAPEVLAQFPRLQAVICYYIQKEEQWQLHFSQASLSAWQHAMQRQTTYPINSWPGL